jgi:hypothetical protein
VTDCTLYTETRIYNCCVRAHMYSVTKSKTYIYNYQHKYTGENKRDIDNVK